MAGLSEEHKAKIREGLARARAAKEAASKSEAESGSKDEAPAKAESVLVKADIDLTRVDEPRMLAVLRMVLGENVKATDALDAIKRAAAIVRVNADDIRPGCCGKVIADAIRAIYKAYKG